MNTTPHPEPQTAAGKVLWAAWGYLVLFGSVMAFSAYIWLLQSTATSLAATYAYVNPLVVVSGMADSSPNW